MLFAIQCMAYTVHSCYLLSSFFRLAHFFRRYFPFYLLRFDSNHIQRHMNVNRNTRCHQWSSSMILKWLRINIQYNGLFGGILKTTILGSLFAGCCSHQKHVFDSKLKESLRINDHLSLFRLFHLCKSFSVRDSVIGKSTHCTMARLSNWILSSRSTTNTNANNTVEFWIKLNENWSKLA